MKKLKLLLLSSSIIGASTIAPITVMSASTETKKSYDKTEVELNDTLLERKKSELQNLLAKKTMYGSTKEYYSLKIDYANSIQELIKLQERIENEPKHNDEEYPEVKNAKINKTFIITTSVFGSLFILGLLVYPIFKLITKLRDKKKSKE